MIAPRHDYINTSAARNEALKSWLHELAPWTHAVTLTLKRRDARGLPISQSILEDTCRHFQKRLNHACFGRRRFCRGHSIASAIVYGWGAYGDHPHLHLSLACPRHLAHKELTVLITNCADQTFWINSQRIIKPYLDEGWFEYLIAHGADHLILQLVSPARP